MDTSASKLCPLLFLLSVLAVFSSGSLLCTANHFLHKQHNRHLLIQTTQHDFLQPPITTLPATPVNNPVTTPATGTGTGPPYIPTPPIVTVPSANPTAPITFPPATQNPVTTPVPVTNPVTTPSTTIPGVQPGVTNPVTTYPAPSTTGDPTTTTTPAVTPPATSTNTPAVMGQSWCIAKSGASQMAIQSALDYACGIADCSAVQMGASCYNPNSLQNHASYAFNSYYQKNPVQTSCDFGGAATVTNVNPSSGSCIFPTGSSSSASPRTNTPLPTPTTESSSGATPFGSFTPSGMNSNSSSLGGGFPGYGDSPPVANISSASVPCNLQPFLGFIIVLTTMITGRAVLDI